MSEDLSQFSMHDLFRLEVEGQREVLTGGLLRLEREPEDAAQLEACMRSAHSLKGAARIVGLGAAVVVAHAMEDASSPRSAARSAWTRRASTCCCAAWTCW
jgi:two-component system sensor histidine kinase and response regulator WspE